jgi:outer membrane receptor for ferrienterochelin and colicins
MEIIHSGPLWGSLVALAIGLNATDAQSARIQGRITDGAGQPLPGVNLSLGGSPLGAATDLDGHFLIPGAPSGRRLLVLSSVGYQTRRVPLNLAEDENLVLELELKPAAVELAPLVITGRAADGLKHSSTSRVEVVEKEELKRASTDGGLLSSLAGRTGIDTRPCALCGASGVGLQGLDPSYTEIQVDGLSLSAGLGGIYGLESISASGLEQVELSKGVSAAGAGAGAMAGSVNLVSSTAEGDTRLAVGLQGGDTWRHLFDGAAGVALGRSALRVSASYYGEPELLDRNDDGLSDTPMVHRGRIGLRLESPAGSWTRRGSLQAVAERRVAGDTQWTREDRGSLWVYGREILTRRLEGSASFSRELASGRVSLDGGLAIHRQDSWYGPTRFDALQRRWNLKAGWRRQATPAHAVGLGLEYLQDDYDDNLRLQNPTDRLDQVPAALLEHAWTPTPALAVESSLRGEWHRGGDAVAVPRLNLRWLPVPDLQLRLAAGSGYRPVTLFSLDKAAHAGFDGIEVPASLKPERSLALSAGLRWLPAAAEGRWMVDATLFRTDFEHKVILSWDDTAGITRYANADEAYSRGVELRAEWRPTPTVRVEGGGTISQVRYRSSVAGHAGHAEPGLWHREHLNPAWTARAQMRHLWVAASLESALTLRSTGPQALPAGRARGESPVYHLVDLDLQRVLGPWTLGLRVENLTDWIQPDSPLVDDGNGRTVDSALIYGPMLGRTVLLRVQWELQKGGKQ